MAQKQDSDLMMSTKTLSSESSSSSSGFENFIENKKSEKELVAARASWFSKHKIIHKPETFKENRLDIPQIIKQLISPRKPISNLAQNFVNIIGTPSAQKTTSANVDDFFDIYSMNDNAPPVVPPAENVAPTTQPAAHTPSLPEQVPEVSSTSSDRVADTFRQADITSQNIDHVPGSLNAAEANVRVGPASITLAQMESLFDRTSQLLSQQNKNLLAEAHDMFAQYLNNNNQMNLKIINYVEEMSKQFNKAFSSPPEVYEHIKKLTDAQLEHNVIFDRYASFFYDFIKKHAQSQTDALLNGVANKFEHLSADKKEEIKRADDAVQIQEQVVRPAQIQEMQMEQDVLEEQAKAQAATPYEHSEELIKKFRMFTFLVDQYKAQANNVQFIEDNTEKGQEIVEYARDFVKQIGTSSLSNQTKANLTDICFKIIEQVSKIHAVVASEDKHQSLNLDAIPHVANQPLEEVTLAAEPETQGGEAPAAEEMPPVEPLTTETASTGDMLPAENIVQGEPEKHSLKEAMENAFEYAKQYMPSVTSVGNVITTIGKEGAMLGFHVGKAIGSQLLSETYDLSTAAGKSFFKGLSYLASYIPRTLEYLDIGKEDYNEYVKQYLSNDLVHFGEAIRDDTSGDKQAPQIFNDKALKIVTNMFPKVDVNMAAQFLQDKMSRLTKDVDNYDYNHFIKQLNGVQNSKQPVSLTDLAKFELQEDDKPVDFMKLVNAKYEQSLEKFISKAPSGALMTSPADVAQQFVDNVPPGDIERAFDMYIAPMLVVDDTNKLGYEGAQRGTLTIKNDIKKEGEIAKMMELLVLSAMNNQHQRSVEEQIHDWAFLSQALAYVCYVFPQVGILLSRAPTFIRLARQLKDNYEHNVVGHGVRRGSGRKYDIWHHIFKKPHPANKVIAHINSLPKPDSQDMSLEKHPGCEFCGSTEDLMGHDKDHHDILCAKCLAGKGHSKKRYTERNTKFYALHHSPHDHHKRIAQGHQKNKLIFELTRKNKPTLWEEFSTQAARHVSPRFLKQFSKGYVMNRKNWLGDDDLNKLTYLVGMYEHAPEKMNEHLMANMHGLAINHRINNKKPKSIKRHLNPAKLLHFEELREHLREHPEVLSKLI